MWKRVLLVMLVVLSVFAFAEVKKIVFWTAPNPNQETFWKELVEKWNAEHPDVQIEWSVIPAAGSSEEAILNAIAAGNAPDICTNIFSGFAAQLAEELDVLVAFDEEFGEEFWKLADARKMRGILEGWKLNGHYYVIPIYSNPMLFWWRGDLLKELGYEKPPRTYSEIYELAKKWVVPKEKYVIRAVAGRNWWDRWFDFITFYYAASGGKPYIENGKAVFNNEYGKAVAEFIYTLFKNGWTAVDLGQDPFENGTILGQLMGPWHLSYTKEHYPEVYPHIVMTPPPVPDNYPEDKPIYTFADTKGLVMFEHCKYKKEAFEFIKWVFSNAQNDARWIELTRMPPAREDLGTNPVFAEYMKDPYFAKIAEAVAYAVPPALITNTIDVQNAMTTYLMEPLMYLKATPEEALKQAVKEINALLW
ncbi:MAG: Sugar ABC transporter, periplasmic sugar-binding protein [Thermotoga sp. 47_83]|jgi:multiple sugar transport system substrate-binding protein|uniref:Extracellular solute-binding protein family 1 n=2 Tax=Thermotoga petrophila TaxID=93929 RepID=D2C6X2_THEP2|nr:MULTISPECIES: extracellular solute-binding protein [Thermotoga]KUK23395.1 MAG: Sugar ABC transporter, periplasmic sugar-binding protein [Thermotoga petrophila]KUK33636.1 MAG: Sugar ABC transporter, periplasmic sugar-binding protein [Thermotoga sp. 47_83]MDK2898229.1 multiple sugar transport system substrate-binding protein [Thermotoga sp.]ADA66708.1 extracellular solute-binding protein family 1 [Thermotoga petrophila RKU-10]KAF2960774.1 sugar ABC transporter substrate-binding protein [Therm